MRIEFELARTVPDTLEVLLACREGVSALLIPDAHLGPVDRDKVATLLGVLDDIEAAALRALRRA